MPRVWMVYWFDREAESLVGENTFDGLSDALVAEILAVPPDQVLGGEWPIDADRAARLGVAVGFKPDLEKYSYCLGAVAV
jgi:hypothetical protein